MIWHRVERNGRWRYLVLAWVAALSSLLIALWPSSGLAQTPAPPAQAVVTLDGKPLFQVQTAPSGMTVEQRAERISNRLNAIARDPLIPVDNIRSSKTEVGITLYAGDTIIMTLTERDAADTGLTPEALAQQYLTQITNEVQIYRDDRSAQSRSRAVGITLLSTLALVLSLLMLANAMPQFYRWLDRQQDRLIPNVRIQNFELFTAAQLTALVQFITKLLHIVLVVALLWFYLYYVLSLFPQTRGLAGTLLGYVGGAAQIVWQEFIDYLPNLLSILLIVFLASSFLRFARWFFANLERGQMRLAGFYPEWAIPTYRLVQFLTLAFSLAVIFPYLPGASSPAFQGVSIFFGLLVSLGAGGVIFSIVAGFILVFTRAFSVGDRIRFGDIEGFVEEKSLLVTRLRTIENILVSIPNAALLSNNIINYTALVRERQTPLVLATTVTLGYDIPWRLIHETLIAAALNTPYILKDPPPSIWQTSLDDFYVSYQLRAYTTTPALLGEIYSTLHQNLQDYCNQAGIEIMSPHYGAMRDGNQSTIPANYLPANYQPPPWNLPPVWRTPEK